MAEISKVQLPNGTTYDLKDANALTSETYNAGKQVERGVFNYIGEIFNDYTNNTATGNYSHAEGNNSHATANSAHAEGYINTAAGFSSHAEGSETMAEGNYSHVEGFGCRTTANTSHAEGHYTCAGSYCQHVQGKFNMVDSRSKYAFIIGNGTSDIALSNAFCVDWQGKIYVGNSSAGVDINDVESVNNGLKNILRNKLADGTVLSGMTANVDEYGVISLSGQNSSSETKTFDINLNIPVTEGSYICTGGLNNSDVFMTFQPFDSNDTAIDIARSDTSGRGITLTIPSGTGYYIKAILQITGNTDVNNLTIYPMIYNANISDESFRPYSMSNSELTKIILNLISRVESLENS